MPIKFPLEYSAYSGLTDTSGKCHFREGAHMQGESVSSVKPSKEIMDAIAALPELVEVLRECEERMALMYMTINPHANYSDVYGGNVGNRSADMDDTITRARTLMARLEVE